MRIAIVGFGLEGRANYEYFSQTYPEAEIVIFDQQSKLEDSPKNARTVLGKNVFSKLSGFDLILRSPGIPPGSIQKNGNVWSATNEFFAKCPAKIIGVTGTKGKGTTASLIASILKSAGFKVHLVGNIGMPALKVLHQIHPDDIVVYELSSFQLWDLTISPTISVVLMVEPDHLDVHSDMNDYLFAKSQITAHQRPENTVIYHPTNQLSKQIADASSAKKLRYGVTEDSAVYVLNDNFMIQDRVICSASTLRLPGRHNQENATAAITAAYAIDSKISDKSVASGLSDFKGLPHRLQFVDEKSEVRYYDDSIATTPGSVIAALNSFDCPKLLILGGVDKGSDYSTMIQEIKNPNNSVRAVLLIGQNADNLAKLFSKNGTDLQIMNLGQRPMSEIVESAASLARPGDVVILSPAAASFDMFKNYQDRGDQFAEAVKLLD